MEFSGLPKTWVTLITPLLTAQTASLGLTSLYTYRFPQKTSPGPSISIILGSLLLHIQTHTVAPQGLCSGSLSLEPDLSGFLESWCKTRQFPQFASFMTTEPVLQDDVAKFSCKLCMELCPFRPQLLCGNTFLQSYHQGISSFLVQALAFQSLHLHKLDLLMDEMLLS